ncbi:DUF664 domain-containing protein [Kitasatospora sp. NPDC058190]|uniref:mycothiol transferase n=1 Tax=Kitasatospora sp. NPDC058190 TaxID=3346371 RepID=UPI0036DF3308
MAGNTAPGARRAERAPRSPRPDDVEGPSPRRVPAHMIEETGRPAGPADVIREPLDGAIGR